jgi:DNA polymerase-3 subunit alpha
LAEFAHLHLHTEFSLLDGMGRIDAYVAKAAELGMKHLAISDHGVMYAARDWYKAVTGAGMHPIIGMEAYLAEGKVAERERKTYHLLLLCENETGYRNLLRLASKASLEGFYYRPRIDLEMLQSHREGLIATSACLGGPVANNLLLDRPDQARRFAGELADIFGPERFYIELQDHGIPEQMQTNGSLIEIVARSLDLPLVATNDVHYLNREDAPAQDVLVCVQTNTTLSDPKRLKSDTDQLYLKSADEMAAAFPGLPEALSNSIRIAEMCSLLARPRVQGIPAPGLHRAGWLYRRHLPRASVPGRSETALRARRRRDRDAASVRARHYPVDELHELLSGGLGFR